MQSPFFKANWLRSPNFSRLISARVSAITHATASEWAYLAQQFLARLGISAGKVVLVKFQSTRRAKAHVSGIEYGKSGMSRLADVVLRADPRGSIHVIRNKPNPSSLFVYPTDLNLPALGQWISAQAWPNNSISLIIAGEDQTFPIQTDRRYPTRGEEGLQEALAIQALPEVKKTFIENLDTSLNGFNPIPTGLLPRKYSGLTIRKVRTDGFPKPLHQKLALVAHRTREGEQWGARALVDRNTQREWSEFADYMQHEIPPNEYRRLLKTYPFTFCVEGGGLDPSPKAYEALIAGSIPIVRQNPTSAAYQDLPVFYVDSWEPGSVTREKLEEFYAQASREWAGKWKKVFDLMSEETWWARVN